MINILISLISLLSSFYTQSYTSIDGQTVSLNNYAGKKVLLVNIATGSNKVGQLAKLEQLYETHKDSLEIIAFPSNSFQHESRTDQQIKEFCIQNYQTTFTLAAKGNVIGSSMASLYSWLAYETENGVMPGVVVSDFQKFLVDKQGTLIGIFSSVVEPDSPLIANAIKESN